jgi:hypothetical protein
MVDNFVRVMPNELKYDKLIDDVTAYRKYINTKPWIRENYVKIPERKPEWISDT